MGAKADRDLKTLPIFPPYPFRGQCSYQHGIMWQYCTTNEWIDVTNKVLNIGPLGRKMRQRKTRLYVIISPKP
jgi:hypothetical protein